MDNQVGDIHIENRSDALEVFDRIINSIKANGDISGYVETACGDGWIIYDPSSFWHNKLLQAKIWNKKMYTVYIFSNFV